MLFQLARVHLSQTRNAHLVTWQHLICDNATARGQGALALVLHHRWLIEAAYPSSKAESMMVCKVSLFLDQSLP